MHVWMHYIDGSVDRSVDGWTGECIVEVSA